MIIYIEHISIKNWTIYFKQCQAGIMPIISDGYTEITIPLLLTEKDMYTSLLKIRELKYETISNFEFFKMCVTGAISLSMKYG